MSSITQIALDLAQLAQNITRLQEQAAAIPERARVAQVEGANQEDAQRTYFRSLEVLAMRIGQRTEVVRRYVDTNAEALQKAADALQNTDGDTSAEARRASAFIEASIASAPPAPGGSSSTPAPAPTSGAAPTAW